MNKEIERTPMYEARTKARGEWCQQLGRSGLDWPGVKGLAGFDAGFLAGAQYAITELRKAHKEIYGEEKR